MVVNGDSGTIKPFRMETHPLEILSEFFILPVLPLKKSTGGKADGE